MCIPIDTFRVICNYQVQISREGIMATSAKIILDSVSEAGVRLTTMELEYPRFIHAETELRGAIARLIAENERLKARMSTIIREAMIAAVGGRP